MKTTLDMPFEYNAILRDGFWPMSRVAPSFEDQFIDIDDVCEEFNENGYFVHQARDCLVESF